MVAWYMRKIIAISEDRGITSGWMIRRRFVEEEELKLCVEKIKIESERYSII